MVSGGYRLHGILHGGSSLSLESEISPSPSSPSGNHLIVVFFSLSIFLRISVFFLSRLTGITRRELKGIAARLVFR